MKSKIAILGSCVSMDNFRSVHNPGYNDNFELSLTLLRSSLISVMQEPVDFRDEEITITPKNSRNKFRMKALRNDLEKIFFKRLTSDIEFLILDLYFDLLFGILFTNRGIFTNNYWDFNGCDFYKTLKNVKKYSFNDNPYEYYVLWTKYCDKFFDYVYTNYPNIRIILNKITLVDKVECWHKLFLPIIE